MSDLTLYIGNKNYSTWSLRPWLAMTVAGIDFKEILIPLFDEAWPAAIAAVSPTKKVPVLHVATENGPLIIPETLAILEFAAELEPELWPEDPDGRAIARAACSEMHAGFTALRTHMPMNIRKDLSGKGMGDGVAQDIERVTQVWRECRSRFGQGGPFLFGAFCNADAMFAPVVSRLTTYAPALPDDAKEYMAAVQGLPAMQAWTEAAKVEPWTVMEDEVD